ncbi:MAG: COX15/CtaA family protein [Sphingobacteriaceae bacterium]|nr:COX15/CtaA family protein [Sphingobacteriaceae bacterium]
MRTQANSRNSTIIGLWLMTGVVMIIIQITLGGITRLTGSGLSITEWKPLLGTIPPLNGQDWQHSFEKYRQIAQFKQLNSHFSIEDFKFIFFWEWFHRLWGRLLGIVFIIPFITFLLKGMIKRQMIGPFLLLFLLGSLQGLLGWIMVKSGLNETDLYVNHIKLAIHFMAAIILLVYNFWLGLKYLIPDVGKPPVQGSGVLIFTLILLGIQLTYGAFMAGLKAGVYAPTWPDINGVLFFPPIDYSSMASFVNTPLGIHFIHRNLAYLISALIFLWTYQVFNKHSGYNTARTLPCLFVLVQVVLGVYTTITSYKAIPQGWGVFEWSAQLHQIVAIFLLLSVVLNLFPERRTSPK